MANHATNGFTLIELMLSITISLLLLGGVVEIYLSTARNHAVQLELSTIQENSRIAFQLLNRAIHAAGYVGCLHQPDENRIVGSSTEFTTRNASFDSATLIKPMQEENILYVTAKPKIKKDILMVISNCKTAEIFQVKHVSTLQDNTQKITTTEPLSMLYNQYAEISELEINTYFIDQTNHALYIKQNNKPKVELVSGINKANFQYTVNNKNQVIGVSIELEFFSGNLKKVLYSYAALQ